MNKSKTAAVVSAFLLITGAFSFVLWSTLHPSKNAEVQLIKVQGTIPAKSKTELIGDSDLIVRGTVKELLPSKWSNPNGERGPEARNIIQTDVLLGINEVFKGVPYDQQTIKVRIDKGQVGQTKWESDGYPDFTPGEEVILFLSKDDGDLADPRETYYVLTGMRQGKFTLSDTSSTGKTFSNDREQITLPTFKEEIPAELEKYKNLPKTADPNLYKP